MPIHVLMVGEAPCVQGGMDEVAAGDVEIVLTGGTHIVSDSDQAPATIPVDVILVDLANSTADGPEAVRRLASAHPALPVCVLMASGGEDELLAAVRAGARGLIAPSAPDGEIVRTLRTLAAGGLCYPPHLAGRVLGTYTHLAADRDGSALLPDHLTEGERMVLGFVTAGQSFAAVCSSLAR